MSWLVANGVILAVILIFAGILALVPLTMRAFHMEPDRYPMVTLVLVALALFAAYFLCKWLYALISRR